MIDMRRNFIEKVFLMTSLGRCYGRDGDSVRSFAEIPTFVGRLAMIEDCFELSLFFYRYN